MNQLNMNCQTKKRFPNKQMADKEADFHNRNLFRDDEEMESYSCGFHKAWHVGHPQQYNDNPVARIHNLLDRLRSKDDRFY